MNTEVEWAEKMASFDVGPQVYLASVHSDARNQTCL